MATELTDLRTAIRKNLRGIDKGFDTAIERLDRTRHWLERIATTVEYAPADSIVILSKSSATEIAFTAALGLERSSINAIRIYTERLISWIYYKDHPFEFYRCLRGTEKLILPSAVIKYCADLDEEKKWHDFQSVLRGKGNYKSGDAYAILSYFLHGNLDENVDEKDLLSGLVVSAPNKQILDVIDLTDQFISDLYCLFYRREWASIPESIRRELAQRLDSKKLGELFPGSA